MLSFTLKNNDMNFFSREHFWVFFFLNRFSAQGIFFSLKISFCLVLHIKKFYEIFLSVKLSEPKTFSENAKKC